MKILTIISQKGGVGKTTIAIHLAVEAERKGYTTAVFDLDPQGSAASWSDKRESSTPTVVPAQANRLETLIEQARGQNADLVIIDSAPNADSSSLAAAKTADLILIPCRAAAFDLAAIPTTLDLAHIAKKEAWVLLNGVPSQGKLAEEAREVLVAGGVKVCEIILHNLIAFSHALNDGRTANEYDPKSKAAAEIVSLFQWIETQTGLQQTNIKLVEE